MILKRFWELHQRGRLAHAYLLIGPPETGKAAAALEIAKMVNCESEGRSAEEPFCGRCPACIKIDKGYHPDVRVLDKGDGTSIKIAEVRELIGRIQLRAFEAKSKVFILKDIENLTPEGSNALLKTLEEPVKDSLLLLTTSVPERNLATVTSRCHAVHFFPVPKDQLAGDLKSLYAIGDADAGFLAAFAQGCTGRARRLQEEGFLKRKNKLIDTLVLKGATDADLKGILTDRETTKEALEVLLSWFRDVFLLKAGGAESQLVHADRLEDLSEISGRYSVPQLQEILDQIVQTAKMLGEQLNVKVALMLLFQKI